MSDGAVNSYFGSKPQHGGNEVLFAGLRQLAGDSGKSEFSHIELRGERPLPERVARIYPYSFGLYDDQEGEAISMSLVSRPTLALHDRSGIPYAELTHDPKVGVKFELRAPLGIKGALDEFNRAGIEKRPVDPKINDAWKKSLRVECGVPPFGDAYLNLWKDGELSWRAK